MRILAFVLAAACAYGHHSLAAEFDLDRPVTIEGTIERVEWINPHAWIYVDVPKPGGASEHWAFEIGSPSEMIRRGWSRSDLRVGDRVSIQGLLARKLPRTANAQSIVLANGKRVFNGRAAEPGPDGP